MSEPVLLGFRFGPLVAGVALVHQPRPEHVAVIAGGRFDNRERDDAERQQHWDRSEYAFDEEAKHERNPIDFGIRQARVGNRASPGVFLAFLVSLRG